LNTKLGDIGANSYATLKEANDYIRNKYGHDSSWDSLDDEGKKRILIQAAGDLETFNYNGAKYYESQALEFPRSDHVILTGNCATPLTPSGFKNSALYSTTYGTYPTDFWKYGTVHITSATPANDVRVINTSNSSTGAITVDTNFTATPVSTADFLIFRPLDAEVKNAQCEQAIFIIQNSRVDSLQNYKELGARTVQIGDTSIEFAPGGGDRVAISSKARKLLSRWVRKTLRLARS
jgi:hypothetical protein